MEAKPEATIDAATTSEGDAKTRGAEPKSSAPPADHAVADTNRTVDSPDLIDGMEQDERQRPLDQGAQREGGQPGGDEEPFPTGNGGECREGLYSWNQSVREVRVSPQSWLEDTVSAGAHAETSELVGLFFQLGVSTGTSWLYRILIRNASRRTFDLV